MMKLISWLFTLIGLLWVLELAVPSVFAATWVMWIVALAMLIIGIMGIVKSE